MRLANSHDAEAAFYAYAYPVPAGCSAARIGPSAAYYHQEMREWILPYNAVRAATHPDDMIMEFLETTYTAAATLSGWDVAALQSSRERSATRLTRSAAR